MPKLTIHGREAGVEAVTTVVRALADAGINTPYYRWHSRLSPPANSRMYSTGVENSPKPSLLCEAISQDGKVVDTAFQKVKEARESITKFMLTNHPSHRPICDKAGEYQFQNYYVDFVQSGTCFNETSDVLGRSQCGHFKRMVRAIIGVSLETEFDSPYRGNAADICPVDDYANVDEDGLYALGHWGMNINDTKKQIEGVTLSQRTDNGQNKRRLKVLQ